MMATDMSNQLTDRSGQGVTSLIRHTIKPGTEAEYEAWLNDLAAFGHNFAGHQGASIIRPAEGGHTYTILVRFDSVEHLQDYLTSDIRLRLYKEVKLLLARKPEVDIQTGFDFWFTPPSPPTYLTPSTELTLPPPRVKPYKQFLVILSAIFPLTIVVHWLLTPLSEAYPILTQLHIRDLLDAIIIVAALTFFIMPHYTRLLARWLYD